MSIKKILRRGAWGEDERNQKLLAEIWGDYINWPKRRKGENGWLVKQLKKYNCQKIFDSAAGDGCDAIYLIKEGFDVIANEIDQFFAQKVLANARKENIQLEILNLDWIELTKEIPGQSFDAVLCLGNSLTCLFERKKQLAALKQFHAILKDRGILIIDERNYQYYLDNRKQVLKGDLHYSGNYLYCGQDVHSRPIEIEDDRIKFELFNERTRKKAYWTVYPFKRGELKKLLEETGFSKIEQYSDYQLGEKHGAEFYFYVCQR